MATQIDPAFKSAWRESQGQPVDSEVLNRRAAAPQEPAPEPVAWLIGGETWTRDKAKADDCRVRGFTVEPLYASPQPANPAQVADAIRGIVEDALNSAIPEPWEVAEHATQRILAAIGAGGQPIDQELRDAAKAMGAEVARDVPMVGAGGQAVAWTDEKGRTLPDLMAKWRQRDQELDRGTWLGVSEIAGRIQRDKAEVRKELSELADAGTIERSDVSNGTFWRGTLSTPPADERVVEALRTLLTLTKFELADNANRQPWARAIAKAETALSAKEGRKNV